MICKKMSFYHVNMYQGMCVSYPGNTGKNKVNIVLKQLT